MQEGKKNFDYLTDENKHNNIPSITLTTNFKFYNINKNKAVICCGTEKNF